jgi:hypothetical protein
MALDVRKFGPKSDKIGAHRGAFVYQEPFKKDSSTASRVINEVVLEEDFSKIGRSREECTKTSSVAHHYHMA